MNVCARSSCIVRKTARNRSRTGAAATPHSELHQRPQPEIIGAFERLPGFHRHGKKNIGDGSCFGPGERLRRHADDFEQIVAHAKPPSDHCPVPSKAARPVIMRKDCNRPRARRRIVTRIEQPSEFRPQPERGKHPARNILPVGLLHLLIRSERQIRAIGVGNRDEFSLLLYRRYPASSRTLDRSNCHKPSPSHPRRWPKTPPNIIARPQPPAAAAAAAHRSAGKRPAKPRSRGPATAPQPRWSPSSS